MKRNPYYRLEYIEGIPYLLAFGQANADFKHDLRLNEISVFLWENLEKVSTPEELFTLYIDQFPCNPAENETLILTINDFINTLLRLGILFINEESTNIPLYTSLEIAGLFCRLYGPAEAFAKELDAFCTSKEFPDDAPIQDICIRPHVAHHTENGVVLVRSKELLVIEGTEKYILLFPCSSYISEVHMSKDARKVNIFCTSMPSSDAANDISYAMRITFLYFAQLHNMLAVHSASILYRDKLWLFSAPSGTGKSTHAELWNHLYRTPVINGDLNLITLQDGFPVVHGIPWCGTSGIYDTHTYPLGGIIFLHQGSQNRVSIPSPERKQLLLLHRSISPSWKESMQRQNLEAVRNTSSNIFVCHYFCNTENEAAECLKKEIDSYLNNP